MKVIIGADHRGFTLKEELAKYLQGLGYEVVDVGAREYAPDDDYLDFALAGVQEFRKNEESRLVLLCGSGHGVEMVANRFSGVRAIMGFNTEVVQQGRQHEDANALVIPADFASEEEAKERVRVFLETEFSGEERHQRRLQKLAEIKSA